MQKEGEPGALATGHGMFRNEEERRMDGAQGSGIDKIANVEAGDKSFPKVSPQNKQSPVADMARTDDACGILRLTETPSNILAGCHDMLEDWKFGRFGNRGDYRGVCENDSRSTQDGCKGKPNVPDTPVLESGYEGADSGMHQTRQDHTARDEGYREEPQIERYTEALDKEDLVQRLCRLFGSHREDNDHNPPHDSGVFLGIRGEYTAHHKYISPHWHGYLPCPVYMEAPKCCQKREKRKGGGGSDSAEDWFLHAPWIAATSLKFEPKVEVWLTEGPYIRCLSSQINAKTPMKVQIKDATCKLEDRQLKELLEKGLVLRWGTLEKPRREPAFMGNVFLHPEPLKRRWRLIYHPFFFNEHVRLLKLHTTRLPRLRRILNQIVSHKCTLKLDLQCAFFQIPIDPGLFVFRKGTELFTLTRLPMGSSVSVAIAQHLSERVAERILSHLIADRAASGGSCNVFVDDIFVSFDPTCSDVDDYVKRAVQATARELSVAFKFCHTYVGGVIQTNTFVGGPEAYEQLSGDEIFKRVETLDVLGVVFRPETRQLRLKDEFCDKLSSTLSLISFENMTARNLWKCIGLCFYTIYAIGVCPARFHGVFRCLSRVAVLLHGADRLDPRWNSEVQLMPGEIDALRSMVAYVLTFPTNVFCPKQAPSRFVFSDASNVALGVVIFSHGRIEVHSRVWSSLERTLPINVKEIIAACQGVLWLCPNKNETVFLGVDNMVALFDLVAGQSRDPIANECVGILRKGSALALVWIPTKLMPADAPSRLLTDDRIEWKVLTILENVTRYVLLPLLI